MSQTPPHQGSTSERKLAAILFADIAGYTALMHKDEALSAVLLTRFQSVMQDKVNVYKGRIVNEMGDGMLCVFDTPNDAVRCAMDLKKSFDQAPNVPVRLGIHSGTVVNNGGKVYGDSVNVASRIESMGIPGAVLISDRVRKDIKNQADIQTSSLGSFHFKNVDEPMDVYAISNEGFVVPDRKELKGKFEEKKSMSLLVSISIVALLLAAILFYFVNNADHSSTSPKLELPKQILNERIAVIPFENNTGDPSLNNLGTVAADWINKGFMDMEDVEVVSNFTIRANQVSIGIMQGDPQGRSSFAELTGAQNLITGTYYKEGEAVVFKLEIVDALEGKLRFSFNPIHGNIVEKEKLINQLRQEVTGFWAAQDLVESGRINVPKYEAYELFLSTRQNFISQDVLQDIVSMDSTFYLARLDFLVWNENGFLGFNQQHFDFLERHDDNLSDYENSLLSFSRNNLQGNVLKAYDILNNLHQKYPKDFMVQFHMARYSLYKLNNPELALSIFNKLPQSYHDLDPIGFSRNFVITDKISCLIKLKKWDEINTYLAEVTPNTKSNVFAYQHAKLIQAIINKNDKNIEREYTTWKNTKGLSQQMFVIAMSLTSLSNLTPDWLRLRMRNDLATFINELGETDPTRIVYRNYSPFVNNDPINIQTTGLQGIPVVYQALDLSLAARTFINSGKMEEANNVLDQIKNLGIGENHEETNAAYFGYVFYEIGVIYTELEKYDLAIDNLKKAKELAWSTYISYFEFDYRLGPLYDRPDFQELNEPVWPDLKD